MRPNVIYSQETTSRASLQRVAPTQSPMFCFVLNRAWDDVLRRSKSRPRELRVQDDSTGNTLLHEACRLDPPPEVIVALKALSRTKNHQGATPLHIAASHRCSTETLRALLDCAASMPAEREGGEDGDNNDNHNNDATTTEAHHCTNVHPTAELSNMGRAPIHYAFMSFRGLDIDAFMLLLDETLKNGNRVIDRKTNDNNDDLEDLDVFLNDDDDLDVELEKDCFDTVGTPRQHEEEEHEQVVMVNVMSMKDALGMTPLALLFRRYRQRVRSVISTVDRLHTQNQTIPSRAALASAMTVHVELGELWEKARCIIAKLTQTRLVNEEKEPPTANAAVRRGGGGNKDVNHHQAAEWAAEQHGKGGVAAAEDVLPVYVEAANPIISPTSDNENTNTKKPCRQFRIVHSSVGLIGYGCPPEMIRLAISIHPHQVKEMDEDGNLPLHIAVKASNYLTNAQCTDASSRLVDDDIADDRSVRSSWSFFSTATISQTPHPFDKVIKILLQHYPEGARTPQGETGQLPLSMAIQYGNRTWEDGIRTLLNAYPPALHSQKVFEPELYPSVLAALSACSSAGKQGVGGPLFFDLDHNNSTNNNPPTSSSSKKQQRHDACARLTLFHILRTKPEWLTAEGRTVL